MSSFSGAFFYIIGAYEILVPGTSPFSGYGSTFFVPRSSLRHLMKNSEKIALVLDTKDNVATLICDAKRGDSVHIKDAAEPLRLGEDIGFGHKAALTAIRDGEAIIKFGEKIGIATRNINPGEWVHIHNIRSYVDPEFQKRLTE